MNITLRASVWLKQLCPQTQEVDLDLLLVEHPQPLQAHHVGAGRGGFRAAAAAEAGDFPGLMST